MCEKMADKKVKDFKEFYPIWIMSENNKNFTKLYYVQNNGVIKIPPEIKKTFKGIFGDSIETCLNKYIGQQDNEAIVQLTDAYVQNWRNPKINKERNHKKDTFENKEDDGAFKRGRNESGYVGGGTEIVLNDDDDHSAKDIKNFQKLKRADDKIKLQYKKGIQ
jgi:hypothetical protein